MKYLATVKQKRNGLQLILWVKFIFWIPIEGWHPMDAPNFINEDLRRWKEYYGEKLTIRDCREKPKQPEVLNTNNSTRQNWFEKLPLHWRFLYYFIGGIIIGLLLPYIWK